MPINANLTLIKVVSTLIRAILMGFRFQMEWRRISSTPAYRAVCSKITVDGHPGSELCEKGGTRGLIVRGARTQGCQNWFMELDVTGEQSGDIWQWAEHWTPDPALSVLQEIERWLPVEKAESPGEA
jgi:hypothetical protein